MRIMLSIYRRHIAPRAPDDPKGCRHASKGRAWNKCSCPIWIDGMRDGIRINFSLKTKNWTKACKKLLDLEAGDADPDKRLKPIESACEQFVSKLVVDGMAPATIKKYRSTLVGTFTKAREKREKQFTVPLGKAAVAAGKRFVQNIDLEFLEAWRGSWTGGPVTAAKRIDRVRSFCKWCVAHGWLKTNPAKNLALPAERIAPTLPYTKDQITELLKACDNPPRKETPVMRANRQRLKALILVARFSGLRISDACMLTPAKVEGGRICLYMAKTGVPVFVPLPAFLMEELARTPFRSGTHWFWGGTATVEATADVWRDRLRRLAKRANVTGPEWHRFRDTFAVELLLQGVPIERVSVLLGHQSIRITEKHYAPWVIARQTQLEAEVSAAWLKDPMAQVLELRRISDSGEKGVSKQ